MHKTLFAVTEEKITLGKNPAYLYTPQESPRRAGIVFYHGWSSSAKANRFRAMTLASHGYTVLLPDAIHHGERGTLPYDERKTVSQYFFEVIDTSTEEYPNLERKFSVLAIEDVMVAGHSMGGYTASSVFTTYPSLKAVVNLNGSFSFQPIVDRMRDTHEGTELEELIAVHRPYTMDPMKNLEKLIDRPILMLAGGADEVIFADWQREFYESIRPSYQDQTRIRMVETPRLGHFVTTNMMEETVLWADRFIGGAE